jgi:hypothetical protein
VEEGIKMPNVKTRFDRLPKWAREEMNYLRRKVDELNESVDKLSHSNFGSNVGILYAGKDNEDFLLPNNSHIAFYTGDTRSPFPEHISAYLEKDLRGQVSLYLAASDGMISILPSSGNAIRIRVVNR